MINNKNYCLDVLTFDQHDSLPTISDLKEKKMSARSQLKLVDTCTNASFKVWILNPINCEFLKFFFW